MGRTAMMNEVAELISDQSEIIKRQAGSIDRLFLLLLQHIEVEEIESELQEMREVNRISSQWDK